MQPNDKGFTFLSALLTITILFITLPFTTYLVKGINFTSNYEELSLQQFYYFLRDDVIKSTELIVEPTKVTLQNYDGSLVTIEKYQNLIRRQIDGQGHEIYLRNIQEALFTNTSNGFRVSITSTQGEQYEKTIIFYH